MTDNDEPELYSPEFTHQLFEEETITFIETPPPDDEEPCDYFKTTIIIRLQDLEHIVALPDTLTGIEEKILETKLQLALPHSTPCEPLNPDELSDYISSLSQLPLTIEPLKPSHSTQQHLILTMPGQLVHTFKAKNDVFELWLTDNSNDGAAQILKKFEKIAMWYIETADSIDFSDDRWQCMFCCRKTKAAGYSLIGYFTLFTFRNPFQGSKLRVCQALMIPPYQGKGIGREMLMCVYRICSSKSDVVEVTVEDPAPGYKALRDTVDAEWVGERLHSVKLDANEIAAVAREFKITTGQMSALVEARQYCTLSPTSTPISDPSNTVLSDQLTQLGLKAKRRLITENPDLKSLSKGDMQAELEKMWGEQVERYERLRKKFVG